MYGTYPLLIFSFINSLKQKYAGTTKKNPHGVPKGILSKNQRYIAVQLQKHPTKLNFNL